MEQGSLTGGPPVRRKSIEYKLLVQLVKILGHWPIQRENVRPYPGCVNLHSLQITEIYSIIICSLAVWGHVAVGIRDYLASRSQDGN